MGYKERTDFATHGNYSLVLIVADPVPDTSTHGPWNTALPALARNLFAFEPWPSSGNTIATETDAFMALVASVEAGPTVSPTYFIYEPWPSQVQYGANYSTYWAEAVVDADGTGIISKHQLYDYFYNRIKAQRASTYMIPVGDVLAEFDRQARLGLVPDGIASVDSLYRDPQHMGDAGRFLAASTKLSVFLRAYPRSPSTRALYREGLAGQALTNALADYIQDLVWMVVTADSRTGVPP